MFFIIFGCSTDLPDIEGDLNKPNGDLSISITESSNDCLIFTFYYDNNFNSILDDEDEQIFSLEKCSSNPERFYFFQDAPNYACSNGGIQVFLFLDLNNDQVYQESEPIIDIQTFCYP
jgi:hypothetical protein